jgi:GNAT superfamily N-acetyltransferase
LSWLNRKRTLEAVDDEPVWSISCFYVRRGYRRKGVMSALIREALKAATRAKARAVEAYPVDTTRPGSTSNVFTGTASAFKRLGFKTVALREPSRPVMRYKLKNTLRKTA